MSDKDTIYRKDAIDALYNVDEYNSRSVEAIKQLPSAEPRKKGKWIQPCDITGFGRCSSCNALWDNSLIENRYFRYCPRCGSYNGGDSE